MDYEPGFVDFSTDTLIAMARARQPVDPGGVYGSCHDGVALFSTSHPEGAVPDCQLTPPLERAAKHLHWLQHESDAPTIGRWFQVVSGLSAGRWMWELLGDPEDDDRHFYPETLDDCGYRYLGPAEYTPPVLTEDVGSHDYHGPVADGRTIPNTEHERFHRAVGDVLAGKIIPEARRQMEEALKSVPREKAPFPLVKAGDPRRLGFP